MYRWSFTCFRIESFLPILYTLQRTLPSLGSTVLLLLLLCFELMEIPIEQLFLLSQGLLQHASSIRCTSDLQYPIPWKIQFLEVYPIGHLVPWVLIPLWNLPPCWDEWMLGHRHSNLGFGGDGRWFSGDQRSLLKIRWTTKITLVG